MLSFKEQVARDFVIDPLTKQPLQFGSDSKSLVTADGSRRYLFSNEVPILLTDATLARDLLAENGRRMEGEYKKSTGKASFLQKVKNWLVSDMRTEAASKIYLALDSLDEHAFVLSVGGGPSRIHRTACNLNIGPFPNVEVVADAHKLPYRDGCVDAIIVEAVIEHLHTPLVAIKEMYRVLKPGGMVMSVTPFLQQFHGYPNHFQNLTLTGHERYFQSVGFRIESSGVAAGPTYALIMLTIRYLLSYLPRGLNYLCAGGYAVIALTLLKPLDKILGKRKNAALIACSTFIVGIK